MNSKWSSYYPYILLGLCIIFYFPFLGSVHLFDWDEINFAESAREMLVTGDYFRVMVDYRPFWEKPPLFFWLQVMSMKIFGINEFAARLPNAIFGTFTILTLYMFGRKWVDHTFAFIWSFLYLISFLPFLYFKSGIIDPVFNFFIFLTLLLIIDVVHHGNKKSGLYVFLAGAVNGLAVLTKGPVGLLLIVITYIVIWFLRGRKRILSYRQILIFLAGLFITSSFWYMPELVTNGVWFIREFLFYQLELFTSPVAGHRQPFFYHFLIVFIGCFPLSVLALPSMGKRIQWNGFTEERAQHLKFDRQWNLTLFWVVMILFTIVKTKIVHYSSMAYLPLSFLAAINVYRYMVTRKSVETWVSLMLGIIGFLFSIIMIAIPLLAMNKHRLLPYIKDPFALAALQQGVDWNGMEWVIGVFYLFGLLMLVIFIRRQQVYKGLLVYGLATLIVLTIYLKMVVPKIEKYSQGAIIEFYQSIQGEDVYVMPVSFKTYAHYFYFRQPKYSGIPSGADRQEWMTRSNVDKPVYIIVKVTEQYVKDLPDVKLIRQAGGYLIYRREPVKN